MAHELAVREEALEGDLLDVCELQYDGCNGPASLREDPYAADVDNTPGVMVWACDHCLTELALEI